ncbi:TPA: hypothetical protein N0F65_006833 [Lagenidium giganteum]|uniref:Uncharacterized protein n=1 Tax=Lagenidium giganteum TaxID=4803 RepID=A0AAV2ZCB3_9STRA|nr:TPA: hypothetical protein N0F65_006833 [Lagenidium giganteum]
MKRSLSVVAAVAGALVGACPDGLIEISVESANGVFCAAEPVCVADRANGACPGPQEGLPDGSYCGIVASGVYGCKMGRGDAPAPAVPVPAPGPGQCAAGESPMSVEGVEGVFCTPEPACVADRKDGSCPGPQKGLEQGSFCGIVQSGVYGCKVQRGKKEDAPVGDSYEDDNTYVDSHDDTYIDSHDDTYVDSHDNTYVDSHDDTYVDSHDDSYVDSHDNTYVDSHDDTYIDSHDDTYVDSHDDTYVDSHDQTYVDSHDDSYDDSYGDSYEDPYGDSYEDSYYDSFDYSSVVADCSGSDGNVPVKVVGFGIFCAIEPVCGGNVLGNCPHVQDGLNFSAVCANVHRNRFGCVEP